VHDQVVRDARRRRRGVEVKHTGDGVMARFDDPVAALACAQEIQEQLAVRNTDAKDPVRVRVGIAFGPVVEERDDLFGTTVVEAVRIMDQADAGQILVSSSVRESVETESFRFGPERAVELKGFPEPIDVHELLWRDS
jgi:class 3 adenylate cyclase